MNSQLEKMVGEGIEDLERYLEEPRDELDRELVAMAEEIVAEPDGESEHRGRFLRQDIEAGKALVVLSYFSILFAIPVFIVPLVLRDNEFSLHHGKAAGLIYVLGMAFMIATFLNCALFLPLAFLCYIPALIGIYRASAGVEAGTAALGPWSEEIFQRIEVKGAREGR